MKKIRFIHISDVLLGTNVDSDMPWADERKKEIYGTFEKIIDRAERTDVDFVFISGNLFDHQPSVEELSWLDEMLGRLKRTEVIYSAGFCDNLGDEAALMTYRFSSRVYVLGTPLFNEDSSENMTVFRDEQATMAMDHLHFPEKNMDVYGVSYFDGRMDAHAIDETEPDDCAVHNVLVACGGGRHRMPIDWNGLRDSSFDYIAMGGRQKYSVEIPGKVYYPGSPESVSAKSTGPHGYICGEIGSDGLRTEFVPVAVREYKQINYHVDNHTKDSELGEAIARLLDVEGDGNIYTINMVRDGGCEKSFDISGMLAGYRILALDGERFERTDYSEYIRSNRNTEFGKMLEKLNDSDIDRSSGAKMAVDMMIDMSMLYSKNNKRMGNDIFREMKRQVRNLLEMECHAYENQSDIKEYLEIRNDYTVSPDVLEQLNLVWAKERAMELEITTLRKRAEELPRKYRREWILMGIRATVIPMMTMGILSIILLSATLKKTGDMFPNGRLVYILIFMMLVIGAFYCAGYVVAKYWGIIKKGDRARLHDELEHNQTCLNALCADRDAIHKKRTELQMLDGRRRNMYESMNDREKKLDVKLRKLRLMKSALDVICE